MFAKKTVVVEGARVSALQGTELESVDRSSHKTPRTRLVASELNDVPDEIAPDDRRHLRADAAWGTASAAAHRQHLQQLRGDDDGGARTAESDASKATGSSSLQHLLGIGSPIEAIHGKKRKVGVSFSLNVIVPLASVLVVITLITVSLAPMAGLWVTSLNSLTSACSSTISKEMEVYRSLLVENSVSAVSTEMSIPPTVASVVKTAVLEKAYTSTVPLHNDYSAFQLLFRGLASEYPEITDMLAAWINTEGEHMYTDWQTTWAYYDSAISSNVTMFWILDGVPTSQRTGNDIVDYNITTRDWWEIGLSAWNGSWTPIYASANLEDGQVIAYTLRPPVSVPVVIQVTYSIDFMQRFFMHFNLTQNGVALLVEDHSLKIIAATAGISVMSNSGGDTFATTSTDDAVRHATEQWLNITEGDLEESHFTMMTDEGLCFVDIAPIRASGGLVLWLFLITPEKDFMEKIRQEQKNAVSSVYFSLWVVLLAEVVIGVVAVVISTILSVFLVRSLSAVIQKLQKVSSGKLTKTESSDYLKGSMLREIDSLNSEVTTMQTALESFSQYVPTQVVRYLCKNRMKPVVGVSKMQCTVMFLDVVDFTHTMEQYGATTVIEILTTMFESFSQIISKNKGCIDKYIGDAIMALWGCPIADPHSEMNACKAVAEILCDIERLNLIFKGKSFPEMHVRIGLHTGEVNAGNVGSSQRLNFTVLGNTVNLASRLEPLNKELHTSVLVSDSIRTACCSHHQAHAFTWRAIGHIQVRGFQAPVLVHEFLGYTSRLTADQKQMLQDYEPVDRVLCQHNSYTNCNINTASTPPIIEDIVKQALDDYLELNPSDYTATQAKALHISLHPSPRHHHHP
ncbi:adenylate cyclase [Pelomyxa schiedti]|nr:adenylate cyclase [Pelomyxa schiedti]